jgi:hypothetical protein
MAVRQTIDGVSEAMAASSPSVWPQTGRRGPGGTVFAR